MTTLQTYDTLNKIVEQGLKEHPLPIKKGKTVFLGNLIVRSNRSGHTVVDKEANKTVAKTFSLRAALAVAKNYVQNKSIDLPIDIDKKYEKHYNDCVFYSHGIETTKSEYKKEVLECRLYTSHDEMQHLKTVLDRIILD